MGTTPVTLTKLYVVLIVLAVLFVLFSWTRGHRFYVHPGRDREADPNKIPVRKPELWEAWLRKGLVGVGWNAITPISAEFIHARLDMNRKPAAPTVLPAEPFRLGEALWQRFLSAIDPRLRPQSPSVVLTEPQINETHANRLDTFQETPSTPSELQVSVLIQMPCARPTALIEQGLPKDMKAPEGTPCDIPPLLLGVSRVTVRVPVDSLNSRAANVESEEMATSQSA